MENENKNHDTQDNKPKFSFRPAETPIEDFPLAEEEEEDETPTSDGYGYSDFEADDGDDDYPEEKLSFRERLAKRRAETEASNAAEQAAFDEDDEYEEHDEKDRAPRPSFRERFAKSRAAQKAAEEETDEDKEDETFSLSLRERLAKRRAEREAAEAAEDDEYDDEDEEELRPTRRRIAVRQSETAVRSAQREEKHIAKPVADKSAAPKAEKHVERPVADKPAQRAEKHAERTAADKPAQITESRVERPAADKPAQREEKHIAKPVADKPAQRAEKPVERPSEDRPTAKKTDSPVKNRRNHAPTAVEKTAQNRKPANQESGSGDKNKSKTFPAFSGSELNAGGADENVKKRFVPIIGAFAAFIAVCVIFTLCASVLTRKTVTGSRVYISEIMTSNSSSVPAPDGEFYDWIELCNPTDEAVDVSGFGFGLDSAAAVWTIPSGTVIPAKGYALVFCAGRAGDSGRVGEVYATFRLSKKGGEELTLLASSGKTIDALKTETLDRGKTMYRVKEGSSFEIGGDPTPLFPNTEEGRANYLASLYVDGDPIKISEIAPKNHIGLTDSFGETSDWIELHNTSDTEVNLKGYKLSDSSEEPYAWSFPDVTVESGGYIYVFCSGRDVEKGDEIHADFVLSSKSGTVVLARPDGGIVDHVEYSGVETNESYADDENGNFTATPWQTPGFANTVDGYEKYAETLKMPSGLIINEVMVGNEKYCAHNGGRYYDWIELYNASDADIDLSEYTLSKELSDLGAFTLPQRTLRPGEYALVMCSGDETLSTSSYIHANFKIDNDGEELFLSKNDTVVDSVYFSNIRAGYSFGRSSLGNGFYNLSQPTPGYVNGMGIRQVSSAPFTDTAEGVYNNVANVKVALSAFGDATVYYTTDCTEPTYTSTQYLGELTLDKTTVVKAVAYEKGKLPSAVVTLSYIVNENHTLPVISLSADPDDLFDYYTGIYADGPGYTYEFPHKGANFWQDWERDAHVAFFADGEDGFSLDCGIKMFGNYGRAYDQKPFQIKFKKKYGTSELHYKMFEQYSDMSVFDALVLRCGSQDSYRSRFRDELFTSLVTDSSSTLLSQAYRACVLYLNGQYWGVYYIREKVDENFLAQHENYGPDSFTMLYRNGEVIMGDTDEGYASLIYFVETHDMTLKENYDYVCSRIDIQNYIDFKIFQAYSGNYDLHNIKYYKSDAEGSDGKWRWIFYDQDYAFRELGDSVARTVESGYHFISNTLIRNLLKNPDCRALYLSRMSELFSSALSADTVLAKINSLYEESLPEMQRHCERWSLSFDNWKYEVDVLRRTVSESGSIEGLGGLSYGGSRIAQVLANLKSTLYLTDEEYNKYFGGLSIG